MAELTLKKAVGDAITLAAANKVAGEMLKLEEITRAELISIASDKSLFNELTKGTATLEASPYAITVSKIQGSKWEEKTGVGAGTVDKFRISKPLTINFNKPIYAHEAITAFEQTLGMPEVLTPKLTKMLQEFQKMYERTSFKDLENKIIKDNKQVDFDVASKTAKEIYEKIVEEATKLTETIDLEQGIDLIDREQVVVFVKPLVFDKIATMGLVGDRVTETLAGGQYSIVQLGGYKVFSNPYLSQFDVVISTNFVAAGAERVIAANVERMAPSNDMAVYFEGAFATGVLWDNLTVGIANGSKSAQHENEIIQAKPEGERLKTS
ncbi:hypothetical protein [Mycoplasmopsis gallinacea]|uniref:Phage major capsid protein n=1 Tax=Mycoplasmopsis gallinacea TaxID=29556 RepID=A0A6H0V2G2_9BACT|nr:hypothetical protein [Mycoplasmopsis gallinacea]QIW62521.1 hypothetical protein GOQ20_03825 [Mycoplasmopsis gallinacea]